MKAMYVELSRLTRVIRTSPVPTLSHFMNLEEIREIPTDHTVTYARLVVDYRVQKKIQTGFALLSKAT